jgi:transcriptional regulator with XRE-family HTH domain
MNNMKNCKILSEFINAKKRPRNQIATLSGLTNTYIRNLENGEIENVPRKRLIALGVALNLNFSDMELLLAAFDRASLSTGDVPAFIETAVNAKLSAAVLPVRDLYAYELVMLSLERTPGRQIIINDRPTIGLMAHGHRTHSDRTILHQHDIYGELIEAIGDARRDNFFRLAMNHNIDHYICRSCLEDYLEADVDEIERLWRARHVAALLEAVKRQGNFSLYLTDTCVHLNFTIKLAAAAGENDKISYSARAPHDFNRGKSGRLVGFISENPGVCQCFNEELSRVAGTVIDSLAERQQQIEYLNGLLSPVMEKLGGKIE